MKNIYIILLLFFIRMTFAQNSNYKSIDYIDGEVIIQTINNFDFNNFKNNSEFINYKFNLKETLSKELNIFLITYDNITYDINEVISKLNNYPSITIVQKNHIMISIRDDCDNYNIAKNLWHIDNKGLDNGKINADINACNAWDISKTEFIKNPIVAVIDNGFQLNHSDLNFYINTSEIPNNGIDDDNNGLIDDINGWNFIGNNNIINQSSHGTHVSGIIGAKDNNVGALGVASGTAILPIIGASASEAIVIKSYNYALTMRRLYDNSNGKNGAFVVATNSSFGIDNANPNNYPLWCNFYDSLGKYGILSVVATTNNNANLDIINDVPTNCNSNYVISVGRTDNTDNYFKSGFSPIQLDISCPGVNIYSTYINDLYGNMSGTSMATPQISGSIIYAYERLCKTAYLQFLDNNSEFSLKLKDILLASVDKLPSLKSKSVSEGRLNLYQLGQLISNDEKFLDFRTSVNEDTLLVFDFYPNPTNDLLYINSKNIGEEFSISIINAVSGKTMINNLYTKENDFNILDLSDFANGMYIINLHYNKGLIAKKIIISR